jgi:murein DD-endopeptidase MepM/ murein hydrolase activator NlpD
MAIKRHIAYSRVAVRLLTAAGAAALMAGCSDASRLSDPFSDPFSSGAGSAPKIAQYRGVDRSPTGAIANPAPARVESRPLPAPSAQAAAPRASTPVAAAPLPAGAGGSHWTSDGGTPITVASGETAAMLATRFGVPTDALLHANGFTSAAQVQPGSRLIIPVYRAGAVASPAPVKIADARPEPKADPKAQAAAAREDQRKAEAAAKAAREDQRKAEAAAKLARDEEAKAKKAKSATDEQQLKHQKKAEAEKAAEEARLARVEADKTAAQKATDTKKLAEAKKAETKQLAEIKAADAKIAADKAKLAKVDAAKSKADAAKAAEAKAEAAKAAEEAKLAKAEAAKAAKAERLAKAQAAHDEAAAEKPQPKVAEAAPAARQIDKATTTASIPPAEEATKVVAVDSDKPEFRWPARGRIIQGFSTGGNDGINIAVPEGTPVKAAEGGTVAYAGSELKGYGNLVLIRHPNGFVTAYAHNGELDVKRGDTVKRGQTIAKSGQSGNVGSPQLHFELRKGSTPVDPTNYLAGL